MTPAEEAEVFFWGPFPASDCIGVAPLVKFRFADLGFLGADRRLATVGRIFGAAFYGVQVFVLVYFGKQLFPTEFDTQ